MNGTRRGGSDRGFTIIEALVTLAIGGFVIATLATVTAQWLRSWRAGYPFLQRSELLAASVDRIVADLAAIRFINKPGSTAVAFTGRETSVTFVRQSLPVEIPEGLETIRLAPLPGPGGITLARARSSLPLDLDAPVSLDTAPAILLREPLVVHFAYANTDRQWQTSWNVPSRTPRLIRVEITDQKSGRPVLAPIIVRVRVDAPALCAGLETARACDTAIEGGSKSQAGAIGLAGRGAL